jgi:thiol-disulfide isomerase/thioredoxin
MRTTALLLLVGLLSTFPARAELPPVGKAAPGFSLRDREGSLVSLGDLAYPPPDRPGRPRHVVVLDFFRTDCAPCKKALPKLVELHRKTAGKPLKLILMALLEDEEGEEGELHFLRLDFLRQIFGRPSHHHAAYEHANYDIYEHVYEPDAYASESDIQPHARERDKTG